MPSDISASLQAVAYYLPSKELTNEQLSAMFPEWSVEKIMNKVGISTRRVVGENEFVSDLATAAGQKLFDETGFNPLQVQYLILCTQSPDYFLPATACVVHERLGLPIDAGAIDINQGCSGYVYGLNLAKGLVMSGEVENVLLITADTYSRFLHPSDKGNRSIFGDAAAATLISKTKEGSRIGKMVVGTNGKGAKNLIVKNGAMKSPRKGDSALYEDPEGNLFNDDFLFMNGTEIFNFTLESVPSLVRDVLDRNQLKQEDIDLFIFHQANKFMLDYLRKKIKIAPERFFIFMDRTGNTVSSTIPIAIKQAFAEGKITRGSKVLIAGFGVGYSWGGTVLFC